MVITAPVHALALHMVSALGPAYLEFNDAPITPSGSNTRRVRACRAEVPQFPPEWFVMAGVVATIRIVLDGLQQHCPSNSLFNTVKRSLPPLKLWTEAIIKLRDAMELKNPQRLCQYVSIIAFLLCASSKRRSLILLIIVDTTFPRAEITTMSDVELDAYVDLAERFLLTDQSEGRS